MTLAGSCGWVAVLVSCAIVIVALLLAAMLGACLLLGAYEQVSNPHASEDARAEYQNATAQIGTGTAGLNHAVNSVTGGGTT